MKKILFLIVFSYFISTAYANTYIDRTVLGYKIRVVQYDISSQNYDIKVVKTDTPKNLGDLLNDHNAISGVNGVFFCPVDYRWCNTDVSFTDNERYIAGEKFASYLQTGDRAVFGWTKDKKPFIYQSSRINIEDENQIYYGLGNYPLLLHEGKNMLEHYYDVGLIDNKMRVKATRNFICSNKEKTHISFGLVYNASIDDLAYILKEFGCDDALNLDAGLSTSFMYNGKYIVGPQKRLILDAVAIERKGLNVQEILHISQKISQVLIERSIKKSKNNPLKQIKYLESYVKQLEKLKSSIYDHFSSDIVEVNSFIGITEKVGYKIDIQNLKSLKLIYTINTVLRVLGQEIKTLKLSLEDE